MEQLLNLAIEQALDAGAEYADIRFVDKTQRHIALKNGLVQHSGSQNSTGFALRVLYNGSWGFAALPVGGKAIIKQLVATAMDSVKGPNRPQGSIKLSACYPIVDEWNTPFLQDPFAKSPSQCIELLQQVDAQMNIDGVTIRKSFIGTGKEQRLYLNSEGTSIKEQLVYSGGGLQAVVMDNGGVQQRSWPLVGGSYYGGGFEQIEDMDLPGNAVRTAREALELSKAPVCPTGVFDIILDASLLASHALGSCSNLLEPYQHKSLSLEISGKFKFASPLISINFDGSLVGGLGTSGFDDEGIKKRNLSVVRNGLVESSIAGRELGAEIGRFSTGSMRSDGWSNPPAPRITNIALQPGNVSLQQLVFGVENGLYLENPRVINVGSGDDNFIVRAEAGWLIERGKLKGMVKNPSYSSESRNFWCSCDGLAGSKNRGVFGFNSKTMGVSIVAFPARFRNVRVEGMQ